MCIRDRCCPFIKLQAKILTHCTIVFIKHFLRSALQSNTTNYSYYQPPMLLVINNAYKALFLYIATPYSLQTELTLKLCRQYNVN